MWTVAVIVLSLAWAHAVEVGRPHPVHEHLLLRPLEDGKVLAHFQFDVATTSSGQHFANFPKSIGQILHRFQVDELHLSLQQGRWRYKRWGHPTPGVNISSGDDMLDVTPRPGPPGAQLLAWLDGDEDAEMDERWQNLQHALAGIFCASLHQMGQMHSSRPRWTFSPSAPQGPGQRQLRYGTLPRENVCTENLTPWIKLLPCRNAAGLGRLLKSYRLFEAFHSMRVDVLPIRNEAGLRVGWRLRQSIDVVADPLSASGKARSYDWSLQSLFGEDLTQACPVSTHANIVLQLPPWAARAFPTATAALLAGRPVPTGSELRLSSSSSSSSRGPPPVVVPMATQQGQGGGVSLVWDLIGSGGLSLGIQYPRKDVWSRSGGAFASAPSVQADRYLAGQGQHRGQLAVILRNTHASLPAPVSYFNALPWFLKLYMHTFKVVRDGHEVPVGRVTDQFRFQPAVVRGPPAEMEIVMTLPPNSTTMITIDFDKAFLRISEFPPDISRGFDIPVGVVALGAGEEQVYTDTMLVLLPFPDGSMPFNVIAFTSTLIAFFFGSVFNLLYSSPQDVLKRVRSNPADRLASKAKFLMKVLRLDKCKRKKYDAPIEQEGQGQEPEVKQPEQEHKQMEGEQHDEVEKEVATSQE